ncbi:hypothetical protein ACFMB7_09770 [Bacillus toyonensis]
MNNKAVRFAIRKTLVELNEGYKVEYATIVLQKSDELRKKGEKQFIVHPVTDFIRQNYSRHDYNYNTQKTVATWIVQFLNWLLIDNYEIYKLPSFKRLEIYHGVDFLNYLKMTPIEEGKKNHGKLRGKSTLEKAHLYISEFYKFLSDKNILNEHIREQVQDKKSLFIGRGFSFPGRSLERQEFKLEHFPNKRLVTLFLETAQSVAPDIAFGVYLQMFGGLRRGEVVNILRKDLKLSGYYGSEGISVKIGYKPGLWTRLKDVSKCKVKRDTSIFPVQFIQIIPQIVPSLVEELFDRLEKRKHINKFNALFIDDQGNPMSGAVYEDRFLAIKKVFLERVKNEFPGYYGILSDKSWSTHIGRGIYTNMIAKLVKSPAELALLRADKSLEAALVYLSKEAIRTEIQEGLQSMFDDCYSEKKLIVDNFDIDNLVGLSHSLNASLYEGLNGESVGY